MKRLTCLLLPLLFLTAGGLKQRPRPLDCDFSKIKGVTSWFDSSHLPSLTVDSVNRAASYGSKTINPVTATRISFTQATDANKGVRTRGDNRENLALSSDGPDNATYWLATNAGTGSAPTVTANATTNDMGFPAHRIQFNIGAGTAAGDYSTWISTAANVPSAPAGSKFSIRAKSNDANTYVVRMLGKTGAAGSLAQDITITPSWTTFSGTINPADIVGSYAIRIRGNEPTSKSADILVSEVQVKSANADPAYVPTTTAPQYRGVNGRSVLRFDGVGDVMTSTAVLSDVFAAGNKTIIAAMRLNNVATIQRIIETAATNRWRMSVGDTASDLIHYNDDGGADTLTSAGTQVTAGNVTRLKAWHNGTNIYSQVNDGAIDSTASGNTSALTATLILGKASAETVNGSYLEWATFNRALSSPELAHIDKCLKQKWGGK